MKVKISINFFSRFRRKMEKTRNQSSLQWHLTRLPTELRLLILEYIVIGSHKSLAKRQMQKGVSYKKHLFMLLENQHPSQK